MCISEVHREAVFLCLIVVPNVIAGSLLLFDDFVYHFIRLFRAPFIAISCHHPPSKVHDPAFVCSLI